MKTSLVLCLDKCMYYYGGKLGLVKCSGFLLFLFGNEWIMSFSLSGIKSLCWGWSETEVDTKYEYGT